MLKSPLTLIGLFIICCSPKVAFRSYRDITHTEPENPYRTDYLNSVYKVITGCLSEKTEGIKTDNEQVFACFQINRDGTIEELTLIESCGTELLDSIALSCISDLSPYPHFPDELRDSLIIEGSLSFSFRRNLRFNTQQGDLRELQRIESLVNNREYDLAEKQYLTYLQNNPDSKYACFVLHQLIQIYRVVGKPDHEEFSRVKYRELCSEEESFSAPEVRQ